MRHYIIETRKLNLKYEHNIEYTSFPNHTITARLYTFEDGTMPTEHKQDPRLANDAILEKLVERNISLMKSLPLSTEIKTEVRLR